jgi:hypothetical protein
VCVVMKSLTAALRETLTSDDRAPLAQVHLNREYQNRAVFRPEEGLDPVLDISLLGAELRALIQGKASKWQDNMTLQRNVSGEGNADKLTPSEAAQVLLVLLCVLVVDTHAQRPVGAVFDSDDKERATAIAQAMVHVLRR